MISVCLVACKLMLLRADGELVKLELGVTCLSIKVFNKSSNFLFF